MVINITMKMNQKNEKAIKKTLRPRSRRSQKEHPLPDDQRAWDL